MAIVQSAAVETEPRKIVTADDQIRIGLVVPEKNVVARIERLDEIVFEQQRFAFRARDGGFDLRHMRDHVLRARRLPDGLLEVRRDAFAQVERFPDVQYFALGVEHTVDAGQVRQASDGFSGVEHVEPKRRSGVRNTSAAQRASKCWSIASKTARNISGVRRPVCVL